jgi:peptide/nickel transport system permease protein
MNILLKLCRRPATCASLVIVALVVFVAVFGRAIAPWDPFLINPAAVNQGSSAAHWLGTDELGRDLLSRLLAGIRPTVLVSLGATLLAACFGTALGIAGGYRPSPGASLVMRAVDILLCFPPILLALLAVGFWPSVISSLTVVIGIVYAPHFARVTQAAVARVVQQEYVLAELTMGATWPRVVGVVVLPNVLSPLVVQATLTVAQAILLESGLSFLGLGIVPPEPSWGQMIGEAQDYLSQHPMYLFWPALCLALTVLAVNLIGDGLRDLLDPRLHRS